MLKLCFLLIVLGVVCVQLSDANNQHARRPQSNAAHARQTSAARARQVRINRARIVAARQNRARSPVRRPVRRQQVRRPVRRPATAARRPAARSQPVARHPAARPAARAQPAAARPARRPATNARRPPARRAPVQKGAVRLRFNPRKRATSSCSDQASNCNEFLAMCSDSNYAGLLRQYCTMTCGHCAPLGNDCVDRYSTCAAWQRKGFCDATFMSIAGRRSMCALTCNLCGDNAVDCTRSPYTEDCLPETCKSDAEKDKPNCERYCSPGGRGASSAVCQCSNSSNKYKQWCGEATCRDATEKQQTGCANFCKKSANTNKDVCSCSKTENAGKASWCPATSTDPDCAPSNKNNPTTYYKSACIDTVCAVASEKTDPNSKCKTECVKSEHASKPACDCSKTENAGKASWCPATSTDPDCAPSNKGNPTTYYKEDCIATVCAVPAEKTDISGNSQCPTKCVLAAHRSKPACDCTDPSNENAKASWCPINADCQNKKVANKYYSPACIPIVCGRVGEKMDPSTAADSCNAKCQLPAHNNADACKCSATENTNKKASWCVVTPARTACPNGNEVTDGCLEERCKDPGQQNDPACITYCTTGTGFTSVPKKPVCICGGAVDNKYASWCAATTCAIGSAESKINWGGCYHHCKALELARTAMPAECTCTANPPTTDYCLEVRCETDNQASQECKDWCKIPVNKNRPGC